MARPTKLKSIDYENRFTVAEVGLKRSIKRNKKSITKYERTLLKREVKKEIDSLDDLY